MGTLFSSPDLRLVEGLLRPFAPSLLSPFTNLKDYDGNIFVTPTTGL